MGSILIIGNDQETNQLIISSLEKENVDSVVAHTFQEGFTIIEETPPELLIIDFSKLDSIEELENLDIDWIQSQGIISILSPDKQELASELWKVGIQSIIFKPFTLFELTGRVLQQIEARSKLKKAPFVLDLEETQVQEASPSEDSIYHNRFRVLINHIPAMLWELDQDLNFSYISSSIERVLGYSYEKLIGTSITDLLSEDVLVSFYFHFPRKSEHSNDVEEIEGLTFYLKHKNGTSVPVQLSTKSLFSQDGTLEKMFCVCHDMSAFSLLQGAVEAVSQEMLIKIDRSIHIVYVDHTVVKFAPNLENLDQHLFSPYLNDPSIEPLFEFCFMQKEDFPFPIEISIPDKEGKENTFDVQLRYSPEENLMLGLLSPREVEHKAEIMSQHLEQQQEQLDSAFLVDEQMQHSIIKDSNNLASEILTLIKKLEVFAYAEDVNLNIEEYSLFMRSKNAFEYTDFLRLLGNKIHGLKGNTGFIIPESKKLCHSVEDITKPLSDLEFIYTKDIAILMKNFIFKVQEMLEIFEKDSTSRFDINPELEKIRHQIEISRSYISGKEKIFLDFIRDRAEDQGEVRHRGEKDYLSVSFDGYVLLANQVKDLFYSVSENLSEEKLIQIGNLYNEFVGTHQNIKKVPVDLSRYERLIPSLAKQYTKEANFLNEDEGVLADLEFWNALHEILNHTLKNAVIHGLETIEERKQKGKEIEGKVIVKIKEDALHVYVDISDDGKGIDTNKIRQKAIEQNIITEEKLISMTPDEVINMVFLQGISTMDQLDDNAGRGVGLNAVQEAMNHFQGNCKIVSEVNKGTSWNFKFPKNNVSLSCFIIQIGDIQVAVPEDYVEEFNAFQENKLSHVNQNPVYRHNNDIIPLINTYEVFNKEVSVDEERVKNILLLKVHQQRKGLIINEIIFHATLPILPFPKKYKPLPIYLGATIYGNQPVLVLNAQQLVE
ncbi:MAG: PAS domain S-box-containing protein [bacterium]|jgi:PAS domain S-box-containing protein